MKPEIRTRLALIRILEALIEENRSLTPVLAESVLDFPDPRDRSLIQFCAYGICREYFRLEAIIKHLVPKPLKEKKGHYLLLIALYQLYASRAPEFSVIHSAVETAKELNLFSLTGLINGVLREFQRNEESILKAVESEKTAFFSHPSWFIGKMEKAWPSDWERILTENNKQAPLWLRINTRKISPEAYQELLGRKNIEFSKLESESCCLSEALDVKDIPGFTEGFVSVQDRSAQYAADLLDLKPGLRILDACAAPGGKAFHILEKEPQVTELIALDKDENRLKKIKENAVRLQTDLSKLILIRGNAETPEVWWDGELFDRILLDAPCSATGVIRRHPDIKLLRTPEDIAKLAELQKNLLKALWPLLKSQGRLLYATCSVLPQENEALINTFLNTHKEAEVIPLSADAGQATAHGWQLFPGDNQGDGFFYAALRKP